jgi:Raf kinase inhibitor-like YbhB/YbcL family protein
MGRMKAIDTLAMNKLGAPQTVAVSSGSFADGEEIPRWYTGDGQNVSPALSWTDLPVGTVSVAVLCEDPDAPTPSPFVHWIAYGLAPNVSSITEGASGTHRSADENPSFAEGKNSFGHARFDGPAPPRGHGVHHYHFQVFALDTRLSLHGTPDRGDLISAMRGHVIAAGDLVGTYER